ncbi:MAG: lysostaphin resistance A-like protein [Planctomycetota bacterium]|jgi:membrane protease YdiL (CAAX protease family)
MGDEPVPAGVGSDTAKAPPPAGSPPAFERPKWDIVDAAALVCLELGIVGLGPWVARFAGRAATAYARAIAWPALTLPLVLLIARRWWNADLAELGVRRPRAGSWRWFVRFGAVVGLGYLTLGAGVVLAFKGRFDVAAWSAIYKARLGRSGIVALVLFMLVAAPLVEELVYRGVLYPALRVRLGRGWAVALSAVIFAAIHPLMMWRLFPPVTQLLGGLIFAWSYEKTRSLLHPVVFHVTGNAAILAWRIVVAYRPGWVEGLFG